MLFCAAQQQQHSQRFLEARVNTLTDLPPREAHWLLAQSASLADTQKSSSLAAAQHPLALLLPTPQTPLRGSRSACHLTTAPNLVSAHVGILYMKCFI